MNTPGDYVVPGTYSYTVPDGTTALQVTVWGAAGSVGGTGGGVKSVLAVTPGQVLQVVVGASGGGGAGGSGAGSGGGETDVRSGSCATNLTCALADRVVVAGSGGGRSPFYSNIQGYWCGGAGGVNPDGTGGRGCDGGLQGADTPGQAGEGGTETAGGAGGAHGLSFGEGISGDSGAPGVGGDGHTYVNPNGTSSGGGGGAGYYGGGGGGTGWADVGSGGGGGSSWSTPSALSSSFLGSSSTGDGSVAFSPISTMATSSTTISSGLNPAGVVAPVTFTATVTPSGATGTVLFTSKGAPITGCAAQPVSGGIATCTTTQYTASGTAPVIATYSGSDSVLPSHSTTLTQTTVPATTVPVVTSTTNPAAAGVAFTLTATVSPHPTGGTITFDIGGTAIAACTNVGLDPSTGTATCAQTLATSGTRSITAVFSGYTDYLTSTSATFSQSVLGTGTTTALSTDQASAGVGASVSYTAVVAPIPNAGTVSFADGASVVSGCGAVAVNTTTGKAVCVVTYTATGAHSIVATYSGATDYSTSVSSSVAETITTAAAGFPSAGTYTYTVPAGVTAVQVTAWGAAGSLGGTGGGVKSVLAVTPGQVLQVVVGASGGGGAGGSFAGSGGGETDVRSGSCATALSCALADRVVVAGSGGGRSPFYSNIQGYWCGGAGGSGADGSGARGCDGGLQGADTPAQAGEAGTETAAGAGGAHGVSFGEGISGDSGALGIGGDGHTYVSPNGTSSGGGGGAGYYGGGGGGTGWADVGAGGGGGSSWATASALSTAFLGSSNTGNGSIAITAISTTTTSTTSLSSSLNPAGVVAPVTFTATVTPSSATGTVLFTSKGAPITGCAAQPVSNGVATCTTTQYTASGTAPVIATYSGSDSVLPSHSSTLTQTTVPAGTVTVVSSSANPAAAGVAITLTATVSPHPTGGTITFDIGGTAIAACTNVGIDTSSGTATCSQTFPASGDRSVTAVFSGYTDYLTDTSAAFTQSVFGSTTTTVLTTDQASAGVGASVSYTAKVTPIPNAGTVRFTDNGSSITGCAAVTVSTTTGKAVCVFAYAGAGSHTIVATYSGATDYTTSFSSSVSETITTAAAAFPSPGTYSYTVPAGVTALQVTVWGAAGSVGGTGGGVKSVLSVTPGQVLQVVVGASGGGGVGGSGAGSGGGETDVRSGSCAAGLTCALADRVVVAGAGGGRSPFYSNIQSWWCGGAGGVNSDGSGAGGCAGPYNGPDTPAQGGGGGSLTAGGAGGAHGVSFGEGISGSSGGLGFGADGPTYNSPNGTSSGGGGGAGYYGGGSGGTGWADVGSGGGGGSSWATPSAVSTAFLGSSNTGNGSVSFSPAANKIVLSASPSGSIGYGNTTTLTATVEDSAGNTVTTGGNSVLPVVFSQPSGTGAVTGLGTATAVAGVATLVVTGSVLGGVAFGAAGGGFTSNTISSTVVKGAQTITFVQPTTPAVYGSSFTVQPASSSGLTVTLAATGGCTAAVASPGWRVTMTSGTTACQLTATQAGNGNYTAATTASVTVAAGLATQATVTATGATSAVYGTTTVITAGGGSGTGAYGFAATGVCAIDSTTATTATVEMTGGVGACTVAASRAADNNYAAGTIDKQVAVTQAQLSVDAVATTKVYGVADPELTAAPSGFVEGDTAADTPITGSAVCSRTTGSTVGDYVISCLPGTLATPDYSFVAGATAQFSITPAPLTITASSRLILYGAPAPTITPSYAGLAGGDTAPATEPTCTTSVDASSPVGSYPSTCSGAIDPNYTISYVPGIVQVAPAAQRISFIQPTSPATYDTSFTVSPTASSGLPVTITASDGSGCSATAEGSDWLITMTSGTAACELTAGQAGDGDYLPAPDVDQTVDAALASQAGLALEVPVSLAYAATSTITATGGSGTGADTFSVASGPCSIDDQSGSTATLEMTAGVGTCEVGVVRAADENYSRASVSASIEATPKRLTVDAVGTGKVYGDDDPALQYELHGFATGDGSGLVSGTADCSRATGEAVDGYAITCTPGTLSADNYSFETGATANFAITPRPLTVTASDATMTFGQTVPEIDPSYENLGNGDTEPATPPTCTTAATPTSDPGEYPSTCAAAVDPDYTFSYVDGTVTVAISAQTIAFGPTPTTKYGDSVAVTAVASSGLPVTLTSTGGCDTVATSTGWTVTITSGIVDCALTASQAGDLDYLPQTASTTIDVTRASQAALALSAPASGIYGSSHPIGASGGSGSGAITVTASGSCTLGSGGDSVDITAGHGDCVVTATRALSGNYAAATVTSTIAAEPATLKVNAKAATAVSGAADPSFGWSLSGFVAGDTAGSIGYTGAPDCRRAAGGAAGSYAITCAPGSLKAADYAFVTGATATFKVTAASVVTPSQSTTTSTAGGGGGAGHAAGHAAASSKSSGSGMPVGGWIAIGVGILVLLGAGAFFWRRRLL